MAPFSLVVRLIRAEAHRQGAPCRTTWKPHEIGIHVPGTPAQVYSCSLQDAGVRNPHPYSSLSCSSPSSSIGPLLPLRESQGSALGVLGGGC